MSIADDKAELRARVRTSRRLRTESDGRRDAEGLLQIGSSRPELAQARELTAYVALTGEPDVGPLCEQLRASGTKIWLPVVTHADDTPMLTWADAAEGVAPGARTPTGAVLLEPVGERHDRITPDVVLVPGLAVDLTGARLGQGAGYYDRTVERSRWSHGRPGIDRPWLVAVLHDDEVLPQVPAEDHDVRADAICTPSRWIRVGGRS
ncbi:MAG: 5-formyltetrahydrofolate cyclo-ligase [Actinomycetales bacterium]